MNIENDLHDDRFHVISYRVDVRDDSTGFFHLVGTFTPAYEHEETEVTKHFLWWTKKVSRITNLSEARMWARITAVARARSEFLANTDVEVDMKYSDSDGYTYTETIWKNGRWVV